MMRRLKRLLLGFAYHAYGLRWKLLGTVKIGVRIMLLRGDTVILVRHSYLPGWMLPGGSVKKLETLEDAARREAQEEVGADITGAIELVGVFANFSEGKSDHVALFVAEEFTIDESVRSWEIEDWRFHPLESLPRETRHRVRQHLEQYRAGSRGAIGKW